MATDEPQDNATPRKPKPRSTKAEVNRRIREIYKLRLGGAEFPDLREYVDAPEHGWKVSNTQLRRYIAAADKLCERMFDAKASWLLSRHLLQRRQLYAHALGAGDFGTALRCLESEAKLENLFDAELVKRIEALETAAKQRQAPAFAPFPGATHAEPGNPIGEVGKEHAALANPGPLPGSGGAVAKG
jgi:hypothetical protein